MKTKNFQISTAIDYPSGMPHVGHMYEKICADAIARWKRLQNYKVHFSTGLDEYGSKIVKSAKAKEMEPQEFVDYMSQFFLKLCKLYNITYDDFIRTTEKRHAKVVNSIFMKIYNKGDVYKGKYEGLYCVDCETFYLEKDLENGNCPVHKKPLELVKEESYFFKMSKYKEKLIKHIKKNPDFIRPLSKRNEILNRLKEPLRDLSISRTSVDWGIKLPIDKKHTNYIWMTALINYLTTVDYPNKKFKEFWPCLHIIGSDIIWHHSIIWGALLMSAGIKLPKIFVHGFITLGGEKMSKSSGIVIDPLKLINKYPTDSIRYFLLRNIPFGEDGDFSEKILIERHNNELANKLGNLISRVSALAEKYGTEKTENKLIEKLNNKLIEKHFENYELDKALNEIFAFIDKCNEYVQEKKPWETSQKLEVSNSSAENIERENKKVLYELAESIKEIAKLLWPFIPETSEKITKQFSEKKIKKGDILFQKI